MCQIDLIGVHGEDLLLGIVAFNLDGQECLLNLSAKTAVRTVEKKAARELHGKRAGPFANATADDVAPRRFDYARQIDSPMLKKMLIFCRGDGVLQDRGNLFPSEQNATLKREISNLLAVIGIELGDHIGPIVLESSDFRQIRGVNKSQASSGSEQHDAYKNDRECKPSREPRSADVQSNRRQWEHDVWSILIPPGLSSERNR